MNICKRVMCILFVLTFTFFLSSCVFMSDNGIEKLKEDSYKEGHSEGYKEGHREGYEEGYEAAAEEYSEENGMTLGHIADKLDILLSDLDSYGYLTKESIESLEEAWSIVRDYY